MTIDSSPTIAPERQATGADAANAGHLGRVGARLERRLGANAMWSWFREVRVEHDGGTYVRLAAPSSFVRDWIADRWIDVLHDCFAAERGAIDRIEIVVRAAAREPQAATYATRSAVGEDEAAT